MAKRKHGRKTSAKAKPANRGKKRTAKRREKVLAGSQSERLDTPDQPELEEEDVPEAGEPKARGHMEDEEEPRDWEED